MSITSSEIIVYNNQRRASIDYGLTEHFTENEWLSLVSACGGSCVRCGANKQLSADHIVPLSRGGKNTIENIQVLCKRCNSQKSTNTVDYLSDPNSRLDAPMPSCKEPFRIQKHVAKTFRFSDDANTLLSMMSDNLGLSLTGVLELAIREKAANMSIVLPPKPTTTTEPPDA